MLLLKNHGKWLSSSLLPLAPDTLLITIPSGRHIWDSHLATGEFSLSLFPSLFVSLCYQVVCMPAVKVGPLLWGAWRSVEQQLEENQRNKDPTTEDTSGFCVCIFHFIYSSFWPSRDKELDWDICVVHVCISAVCAHVDQALISIWVGLWGCL